MQTGSIFEGIVKDMMPDASVVSLPKVPDLFMQLNTGKVEAIVEGVVTANGYLAQDDSLMLAEFTIDYDEDGTAVAVQKGNTELLEQINETIADVVEEGAMEQWLAEAQQESQGLEEE